MYETENSSMNKQSTRKKCIFVYKVFGECAGIGVTFRTMKCHQSLEVAHGAFDMLSINVDHTKIGKSLLLK